MGNARADPVRAGRACGQPVREQRAGGGAERMSEKICANRTDHRARRGGVQDAGRIIRIRLGPVDPRDPVADLAKTGGNAVGTAKARQQQIGGGVVTLLDGRRAQGFDRHGAFGKVGPRDRSMIEQILPAILHDPIELFASGIDPRQQRRHGKQLEDAAHRESLVGAPGESLLIPRIDGEYAKPAAMPALQHRQRICGRGACARPGCRDIGGQASRHRTARYGMRHECSCLWRGRWNLHRRVCASRFAVP